MRKGEILRLSVIIPVYNERQTLLQTVKAVLAVERAHEILIIDDGSTDGTRDLYAEVAALDDCIRIIMHEKNMGKGAAIRTGFRQARGDIFLIQDADLEYDPRDYPDLLQPIEEGRAAVVYGSRFRGGPTKTMFFWHMVGNKFLTLVTNILYNTILSDMETCYKVFRADVVQGTSWGAQGHTPVVALPGKRQSVSAASAVNAKGGFWFATFSGAMRAPLFVTLLKQLLRHRKKPLFLILDSLPAHKAKMVQHYVASTAGRVQLFFLPGYAPELNPDELVWNHAKRTGAAKRPLKRGECLRERVQADLTEIQRRPALIRSFFREPSVAYITD